MCLCVIFSLEKFNKECMVRELICLLNIFLSDITGHLVIVMTDDG